MRILISLILLSAMASVSDPVTRIAKANKAKEKALEAYRDGEYKQAIKHYRYLLDSLDYASEEASINLANALYYTKDTANAASAYASAAQATNPKIKSQAYHQLGIITEQQQKPEEALEYFKSALKADPTNQKARYNYELLKKKLEQQKEQEQQQDQKNQDQNKQEENQDKKQDDQKDNQESQDSENQQNKEDQEKQQQDQEGEEEQQDQQQQQQNQDQQQKEGEEQNDQEQQQEQQDAQKPEDQKDAEKKEQPMDPSTKQKLQEMNMSEEKAQMILEALRNNEAQYIQQMRKRAKERPKSGKPDW